MILSSFQCIYPSFFPPASTQTTIATRKPRLERTASQKKRTAAKAAETRARNKAAKAAQNGESSGAIQPNDASTANTPLPQISQVQPELTLSGNVDNDFGA